jgi:hypothetical protein
VHYAAYEYRTMTGLVTTLRRLTPPASQRAAFNRLTAAMTDIGRQFARSLVIRPRDTRAYERLTIRLHRDIQAESALARRLLLFSCVARQQ